MNDLLKKMNISYLYPYQRLVIEKLLSSKLDLIIRLPTGYGKTLCFTISSLLLKKKSLVIYPLRSLINDQERRLKENVNLCILKGEQSKEERKENLKKIKSSKMILISIETLLNPKVFKVLNEFHFDQIIIDEAHVFVQWGLTFRPSCIKVAMLLQLLKRDKITLFTATSNKRIKSKFKKFILFKSKSKSIQANIDRANIHYYLIKTLSKKKALMDLILDERFRPSLIFFSSKDKISELYHFITYYYKLEVYYYHADIEIKREVEEKFFSSTNGILLATKAYGMGIDKKNIKMVIHYDIPDSSSDFLQESGRAARDGSLAYSILLFDPFSKINEVSKCFNSNKCIRSQLLENMDIQSDECSGCSFCNNFNQSIEDGIIKILKILRFLPFYFKRDELLANLDKDKILNFIRERKHLFYLRDHLRDLNMPILFDIFNSLKYLDVLKEGINNRLYLSFKWQKKLLSFFNISFNN